MGKEGKRAYTIIIFQDNQIVFNRNNFDWFDQAYDFLKNVVCKYPEATWAQVLQNLSPVAEFDIGTDGTLTARGVFEIRKR